MSVLSRLLFTFSLAAVAGATLHAQQPAQKPPTIRVGVDRVNIGVAVAAALLASAMAIKRHGERTKAAIAEQRKFSALLRMLRAGVT